METSLLRMNVRNEKSFINSLFDFWKQVFGDSGLLTGDSYSVNRGEFEEIERLFDNHGNGNNK